MLHFRVVNDHGQFKHNILRISRDMDIGATMIRTDTTPAAGVGAVACDTPRGFPDQASQANEGRGMPDGSILLAESAICGGETMASPGERFSGVQRHPAVSQTLNRQLPENVDCVCPE